MTAAAKRLPDWQARLGELVSKRLHDPFAWGARDCCLWAADVVVAVTGVDPAEGLRGQYANATEAAALLDRFDGLSALCDQRLGVLIPAGLAQPGDVGLVHEGPMGAALVAHTGGGWTGQGPAGLVAIRGDAVLSAWRCCRG